MISDMSSQNGSGVTDLEQKIIRQIEYYFGDFNLPRDKFLIKETKLDNGWVSFETMTKFNRLASMSKDPNVLVEALRKSSNDVVTISEDGTKLRRNPDHPAPPSMKEVYKKYEDRTLFVKGFGPGESLDDIESFLQKAGATVNVVMRRRPASKNFKGSIFVSFKDKESSDKFLTDDEFKTYKDKELIRKLRTVYVQEKTDARKEAKAKTAEARAESDEKRMDIQRARLRSKMTLGALLELSGIPTDAPEPKIIGGIKSMMREDAKTEVAFVHVDKLKESGQVFVRFREENTAAEALQKLQAKEDGLKLIIKLSDEKALEEGAKKEEKADENGTKEVDGDKAKMDDDVKKEDGDKKEADEGVKEEDGDKKETDEGEKKEDGDKKETDEGVKEEGGEKKEADEDTKMETEEKDGTEAKAETVTEEKVTIEANLTGRVLIGQEEEKVWVQILEERQQRQMKRKGGFRRGGRDGEPSAKKGRYHPRRN